MVRGLEFYNYVDSANCTVAFYTSIDNYQYYTYNKTLSTLNMINSGNQDSFNIEAYLNLTQFMSTSMAESFNNCPVPVFDFSTNVYNQVNSLAMGDSNEIFESFIFNLMERSL